MNYDFKYNYAILCVLLAGSLTGSAFAEIPETVTIGGIFDVSGEWSLEGEAAKAAAELAIEDFNKYLDVIGAGWSMSMQVEDAQATGSVAFDKLQTLTGSGIQHYVGMGYSSHINTGKSYIDSNNLLIISHASQAENLAIDDTVFRLRPNDGNQAPEVSQLIQNANITVLVTVNRGDVWGDGLINGVKRHFEGEIIEGVRYDPEVLDFSAEISLLDESIADLVEEHGADKIGVLYVGTDEFLQIIESARLYDNIDDVRWFSTNTQARSTQLIENERAFEFTKATQFTALEPVDATNTIKEYINKWAQERYGRDASVYTYASYDSIWLLGVSIQQAQTADVETLTKVIPLVAHNMIGATGHLELSAEGDLSSVSYNIVHVGEDGWTDGLPPENTS